MTAIEQAFLDDIAAQPHDDAPRLIYADWLEEHGDAERAEFIRVQIELAKTPEPEELTIGLLGERSEEDRWRATCRRCRELDGELCKHHSLRRREIELLSTEGPPILGTKWRRHPNGREETLAYRWAPMPVLNCDWWEFRRGFIHTITLPCAVFLEHAASIIEAVPMLEEVRLSDKSPTYLPSDGSARWHRCDESGYEPHYILPEMLYDGLLGGHSENKRTSRYNNDDDAFRSLSNRCLQYASEQRAARHELRTAEYLFGQVFTD